MVGCCIIIQVPIMYRAGGVVMLLVAEAETTIENNTIKCVSDLANLLPYTPVVFVRASRHKLSPHSFLVHRPSLYADPMLCSWSRSSSPATVRCNSSKLSANEPFAAHFMNVFYGGLLGRVDGGRCTYFADSRSFPSTCGCPPKWYVIFHQND